MPVEGIGGMAPIISGPVTSQNPPEIYAPALAALLAQAPKAIPR